MTAANHLTNGTVRRVSATSQTIASGLSSLPRRTQSCPMTGMGAWHSSSGKFTRQRRQRGDACVTCSLQDTAVGLGLFFTPSVLATIYAAVIGKGNVKDGYSKLLTQVSVHSTGPCCVSPEAGRSLQARHAIERLA